MIINNVISSDFRYATNNYRSHPRGLIIYGPATVASFPGNASAWPASEIGIRAVNNSSKLDTTPTGTSGGSAVGIPSVLIQDASTPNVTDTAIQQRCPLIPPNLGK